MQKTRQAGYDAKLASKRDTRPKYIQDLLDKAVDRKMEQVLLHTITNINDSEWLHVTAVYHRILYGSVSY